MATITTTTTTTTVLVPPSVPEYELTNLNNKALPSSSSSDHSVSGSTPRTKLESFAIITVITGVTFVSVSGTGILITALPQISTDINLARDLIFWPASLGNSVGLAVAAVIAASVSAHDESDISDAGSSQSPKQLLKGYRAAYWTIFAGMVVVCLVSGLGLRNVGKVGVKQD
ncbi:hypothetical protein BDV19DRAFT_387080 [Aspergillus venezuelensis]